MHLLSPLSAGVRGAENGWAELYIRGTASRATYYTDFEGTLSVSTGANVTLDANGAAEVYVNQLVDVIVRSSDGTLVRSFTAGESSPAVEVRSNSFTGTSYIDGASAAGNPTTAQAVFDAWLASAGSTDWKVSVGGASTNINDAIASLGGVMFNVKSTAYGATGDGTTDDSGAISAAITAAQAVAASTSSGAVVVFPPGTYRIGSVLTLGSRVSLLGFGAVISNTSAASNSLVYTSASASHRQLVRGFKFTTSTSTAATIEATANVNLSIENCEFVQGPGGNGAVRPTTSLSDVSIVNCKFTRDSTVSAYSIRGTNAKRVHIENCEFVYAFPTDTGVCIEVLASGQNIDFSIIGCRFDVSAITSGTVNTISMGQTDGNVYISGCRWTNKGDAAATVRCIHTTGAGVGSTLRITEVGNSFGGVGDATQPTAYGTLKTICSLLSRETRQKAVTDAGSATLALDADQYGVCIVRQTTNGAAQTLDLDASPCVGSSLIVVYHNDSAGITGTITWGTGVRPPAATFTVNSNCISTFLFRQIAVNSTSYWMYVGAANVAE